MSLVQANLKRRHFAAVVVVHVAIGIQRRAFWDLKALVVVEAKRHQVGQFRELFRDAAWHHPAAQNLKFNKNQHKTHALSTGTQPTSELIDRDIEDSQIDKFAELLGQRSCEKSKKC